MTVYGITLGDFACSTWLGFLTSLNNSFLCWLLQVRSKLGNFNELILFQLKACSYPQKHQNIWSHDATSRFGQIWKVVRPKNELMKFCLSWQFDKHDPEMRYVYKHEEDEINDLFSEQFFKSIYTSYLEYLFVFWKLIVYSKINFDFFLSQALSAYI